MLVLVYVHPVINLINFGADKNNIITVWRNYDRHNGEHIGILNGISCSIRSILLS